MRTNINKAARLLGLSFFCMAAMLPVACSDDEQQDTSEAGALLISTSWMEAYDFFNDITEDYFLASVDGGDAKQLTLATYSCYYPDLLTSGTHSVLAYNEAKGITIDGNSARVNQLDDDTVEPMPNYFFMAKQDVTINGGDTVRVDLEMKRLVYPVTMTLDLEKENTDRLENISATLSGVAGGVDFESGEPLPGSVTIKPQLGRYGDSSRAVGLGFSLLCRVMGVDTTSRQILTINFIMDDGSTRTVTSDLTDYLKDITTRKSMSIKATVGIPQDGQTTGEIDSWQEQLPEIIK